MKNNKITLKKRLIGITLGTGLLYLAISGKSILGLLGIIPLAAAFSAFCPFTLLEKIKNAFKRK